MESAVSGVVDKISMGLPSVSQAPDGCRPRENIHHLNFGIDVINQIRAESPHLWTPALQDEVRQMLSEGCALEIAYGRDTMPRGLLGLNAELCGEYMPSSPTDGARSSAWRPCSVRSRTRFRGCRKQWT